MQAGTLRDTPRVEVKFDEESKPVEKIDFTSFLNDSMTISKQFDKLNYEQLKVQYSTKPSPSHHKKDSEILQVLNNTDGIDFIKTMKMEKVRIISN